MEVRGTAFLARKSQILNSLGEEKWVKFIEKLSEKDAYFKNVIVGISLIPVEKFLLFQEELTREFFNNDQMTYWTMGEKSAEFALIEGPYKIFLKSRDLKNFIEQSVPSLWNLYYTAGEIKTKYENKVAEIEIKGLINWHIYFEYVIAGYVKRALELLEANFEVKKIKGVSSGDKEIHYQFLLK